MVILDNKRLQMSHSLRFPEDCKNISWAAYISQIPQNIVDGLHSYVVCIALPYLVIRNTYNTYQALEGITFCN